MALRWFEQLDIVKQQSNITRQKAEGFLADYNERSRQRQLAEEAEAITSQQKARQRTTQFARNQLRNRAFDDITATNKILKQLGMNAIGISESSLQNQIMSGFSWAQSVTRQAREATRQARLNEVRKEGVAWAKWVVRQRGEIWADLSPAQQEAAINQEFEKLLAKYYPEEYGVQEPEAVTPAPYEPFKSFHEDIEQQIASGALQPPTEPITQPMGQQILGKPQVAVETPTVSGRTTPEIAIGARSAQAWEEGWLKDNFLDPVYTGATTFIHGLEMAIFSIVPSITASITPPSGIKTALAALVPWGTMVNVIAENIKGIKRTPDEQRLYESIQRTAERNFNFYKNKHDAWIKSHPELAPDPAYLENPFENLELLLDPGYYAYSFAGSLTYTLTTMATIITMSAIGTPVAGVMSGVAVAGAPESADMTTELVAMGIPFEEAVKWGSLYGLFAGSIETVSDLPLLGILFKPFRAAAQPLLDTMRKAFSNWLVRRIAVGVALSLTEGLEEGLTQIGHNAIIKHYDNTQSILEGVDHAFIQASIAALPFTALGGGASYRTFRDTLPANTRKKYDEYIQDYKKIGFSEEQAQVRAANEIARTPEGRAALENAIDAANREYQGTQAVKEGAVAPTLRNILRPNKHWAVISAETAGISEEANAARSASLRAALEQQGYKFHEGEGVYAPGDRREHIFLVEEINEFAARALGNVYGQESVLVPRGLLYSDNTYTPADSSKISYEGKEKEYYSLVNIGGKQRKFSIPISDISIRTAVPMGEHLQTREGFVALLRREFPVTDIALDAELPILKSKYQSKAGYGFITIGTKDLVTFTANPADQEILIRLTALHEVGHEFSPLGKAKDSLTREVNAWKWAFQQAPRYGITMADAIRAGEPLISQAHPELGKGKLLAELREGGVTTPMAESKDVVQKLTELVKQAIPIRKITEGLKHEELVKRAAAAERILQTKTGREAFEASKVALRGALPQAEFTPPQAGLSEADVTNLFNLVKAAPLRYFDKLNTSEALIGLLSGEIPTTSELELLERVFGVELAKAILSKRTSGQKAWEATLNVLNLPRAVLASWDLSAPLRQGALLFWGQPKQALPAMKPMVKAFFSEKNARMVEEIIDSGKYADLRRDAGLYIAPLYEVAPRLQKREEAFMTTLARYIPLVKHSERAYVTYLNKLRADVFDAYAAQWEGTGKTMAEYKSLATAINIMTGRGSLGKLSSMGGILNAAAFSPRYIASRVQFPIELVKASPVVRKMMVKNLLTFVSANLIILSLAKIAGESSDEEYSIESDPRSTDFGKLKIGNTRLDFWAGFQQYARFVCQLLTGMRKTSKTGKLNEAQRWNTLEQFIRSKASPMAGLLVDILKGETFLGDEFSFEPDSVREQAFHRLVPMFAQDLIEAIEDEGLTGALIAFPGLLGVGVQTYGGVEKAVLDAYSQFFYGMDFDELSEDLQKEVRAIFE